MRSGASRVMLGSDVGVSADEIEKQTEHYDPTRKAILRAPTRSAASALCDQAIRDEMIGGASDKKDLLSFWDYLHGSTTRKQFDDEKPGTSLERFKRWVRCDNKTAPKGVPDVFAQGACYIRNAGIVFGVLGALYALDWVTKE